MIPSEAPTSMKRPSCTPSRRARTNASWPNCENAYLPVPTRAEMPPIISKHAEHSVARRHSRAQRQPNIIRGRRFCTVSGRSSSPSPSMGLLSCHASEAVTAEDEAAGIDQDHRDVTATHASYVDICRANTPLYKHLATTGPGAQSRRAAGFAAHNNTTKPQTCKTCGIRRHTSPEPTDPHVSRKPPHVHVRICCAKCGSLKLSLMLHANVPRISFQPGNAESSYYELKPRRKTSSPTDSLAALDSHVTDTKPVAISTPLLSRQGFAWSFGPLGTVCEHASLDEMRARR